MNALLRLTARLGLLFMIVSSLAHAASAAVVANKADFLPVMTAIPEPSTYAAFAGVGALGLVLFRRLRRAK